MRVVPVILLAMCVCAGSAEARKAVEVPAVRVGSPLRLEVQVRRDVRHEFTGYGKSYGLKITNRTDHAVVLERAIEIESKSAKGWRKVSAIQAVADCAEFDLRYRWKAPVRLAAHGVLTVVPWDGFECGGQCPAACLQNTRLDRGRLRFVVVLLPSGRRILSAPFKMGDH